jgi:hypothetical protein
MLKSFEDGRFQGRVSCGLTYDWTAWDGTPNDYEAMLVDNYLALLVAMPADCTKRTGLAGLSKLTCLAQTHNLKAISLCQAKQASVRS